jgi:hypothetical protein
MKEPDDEDHGPAQTITDGFGATHANLPPFGNGFRSGESIRF